MNQDDVAGLNARRHGVGMIGLVRTHKVSGEQASECRLLLGSLIAERVHVIDVAAGGGLRFAAGANGHGLFRLSFDAVRIGENEMAFVIDAGIEIKNAAGKHVRRDIAVIMPAAFARHSAEDLFVLEAEKREAISPLGLAFLAISDVDACVAIVVSGDFPGETERDQGRRVDDEFAGNSVGLRKAEEWKQQGEDQKVTHGYLFYPQSRLLTRAVQFGAGEMRADEETAKQKGVSTEGGEKRFEIAGVFEGIDH